MKTHLQALIAQALESLLRDGLPSDALPAEVPLERARDRTHGDYASAIALALAKTARRKPRELAEQLVAALPRSDHIAKVEIAGPGFINFFLAPAAYRAVVQEILDRGDAFGRSQLGGGRRVQVEFVSANPTGPLHVCLLYTSRCV